MHVENPKNPESRVQLIYQRRYSIKVYDRRLAASHLSRGACTVDITRRVSGMHDQPIPLL